VELGETTVLDNPVTFSDARTRVAGPPRSPGVETETILWRTPTRKSKLVRHQDKETGDFYLTNSNAGVSSKLLTAWMNAAASAPSITR
jgi:hypothetical protein